MEIAALGLRVDGAAGIDKATDALDGFAAAAGKAERATDSLGKNSSRTKDANNGLAKSSNDGARAADAFARANNNATKATQSLAQASQNSSSQMKELANIAVRAGAALGAAFSVNALKNYVDSWSDMQSKVGAATRDMAGAGNNMQRLVDIANASYAPLQQTVQVYSQNVATFRDLGRSAAEAADFTEAVNHALVTTATRGQDADVVVGSLSRSLAIGKLDADAFDTIISRSPRVLQAMADHLGVTTSELRALAMQSKVTNDVIATGLISSLPKLSSEAGEMSATLADAFQRMDNNIIRFIGTFDQANGSSRALAEGLLVVGDNIDLVVKGVGALGLVMASRLIAPVIASGVAFAGATSQATQYQMALARMAGVSTTAAAGIGLMAGATRTLSAAMGVLGGPFGLLITTAGIASAAWLTYASNNKEAQQALEGFGESVDEARKKMLGLTESQREMTLDAANKKLTASLDELSSAYEKLTRTAALADGSAPMAKWKRENSEAIKELISQVEAGTLSYQDFDSQMLQMIKTHAEANGRSAAWVDSMRNATAATSEAAKNAEGARGLLDRLTTAFDWVKTSAQGAAGGINDANNAMGVIGEAAGKQIAQLDRQIALFGQTGTAAALRYDLEHGSLKDLNETEKAAILLRADQLDGLEAANRARTNSTSLIEQERKAFESSLKSLFDRIAAEQLTLEILQKYGKEAKKVTDIDRDVFKLQKDLAAASTTRAKAEAQKLLNVALLRQETERATRAEQERLDLIEEYTRTQNEEIQTERATNEALEERLKNLNLEIALIGKSAQAVTQANAEKLRSEAQWVLQKAETMRIFGAEAEVIDELIRRYQLLTALADGEIQKAAKTADEEVRRDVESGWDKTSQTVSQTLQDYIMGGGKDAAQYLKRLFATLVLQPIVNYGVQGVMGMLGGGGQGAAAQSGGFWGGLGNSGGGFTNWSGWGGNLSSGIGNLGNSIGGGLGESLVSLGSTVSEFDAWLSKVPGFEGGLGSVAGYATAIFSAFNGDYFSALGGAVGTYFMPGIGTMIGSWLGGLLDGLDGSGDVHEGATGYFNTQAGAGSYQSGPNPYNTGVGDAMESIATGIGASFGAFLNSFGLDSNVDVRTNWLDDFDGEGGSWGNFSIAIQNAKGEWEDLVNWATDSWDSKWAPREFDPMEQGIEQYMEAVAQSYVEALKQVDLPSWAQDVLGQIGDDAAIEDISATLNQLSVMRAALSSWQSQLAEFSNVGDAAFGALLDSMGGFENLATGVSSFVDLYYSEQEKLELQQKQLTDQLAKMNVELPTSKEAWRELVDGALAAGEGGAELAALLLSLGPAFAQYADNAEAAAQAQIDAQKAAIDALYSDAGISGDTIAQILRDGMLGRLTQEDVGAQLSGHIIDGIYNSIAGGFAQQITDTFTSGIITPLLQAAATGSAMSGVVSQASIDAVVGQARASVAALQAILNDPALQQAIADINATISGLSIGAPNVKPVATVTKPRYSGGGGGYGGAASSINAAADNFARIAESLQDVIDRWRLDVLGSSEAAQQNLEAEFAILTAQARAGDESAASKLPDIMSKLLQYTKENSETLHEQMLAQIKYMNSLDETSKIVAGLGGGGATTARRLAEDYEFLSGVTGAQHDPNSRDGLLYATRALERGSGVDDLLAKLDYAAELSASSVRAAYEAGNLSKEDLQSAFLNSYQSSLQQFETTLIGGLLGNQGYGEYAPAFSNAEYAVLLNKLNDLYAAADLDRNAAIGMTVHPEFNEIWKKLFGFSEVGAIGSDQQEAIKRWEEIQKQLANVASYDVGTGYVPSTGVAMIHKGERIIPAVDNEILVQSVQGMGQGWRALETVMQRGFEDLNARLEAIEDRGNEQVKVLAAIHEEGVYIDEQR